MSDSRSQAASPRKLARARAEGDVALSADLVSSGTLVAVLGFSGVSGVAVWRALSSLMSTALTAPGLVSGEQPFHVLTPALSELGRSLAPLFAALLLAAGLLTLLQAGFAPAAAGLRGTRLRMNAWQRTAQSFSAQGVADHLFLLLKLAVLAWLLGDLLWACLPALLDSWQRPASGLVSVAFVVLRASLLRAAIALALIGVCDLGYRHLQRRQRLRMSFRELRDEQRQAHGDPRLLSERGRQWRELSTQATLAELSRAALVVRFGTRCVALRFDPQLHQAPVLWLKADGALAQRVLDQAAAQALPTHEDSWLLSELCRLELTQPITDSCYAEVARLLADSTPHAGRS